MLPSRVLPPLLGCVRNRVTYGCLQRHEKRAGWAARESDPLFHSLAAEFRPLTCPIVDTLVSTAGSKHQRDARAEGGEPEKRVAPLPRVTSLLNLAQCVEQWKRGFERSSAGRTNSSHPVVVPSPAAADCSLPVRGVSHPVHGDGKQKREKKTKANAQ